MAIRRPCPSCGAHVPLAWNQAWPVVSHRVQATCPSCGQFLAFPANQLAVWHVAFAIATVAMIAYYPGADGTVGEMNIVYAYMLFNLVAVSAVFHPFWDLVAFDASPPGRERHWSVVLLLMAVTFAIMLPAALWLYDRFP
jgi:ribosomal protein S27AE